MTQRVVSPKSVRRVIVLGEDGPVTLQKAKSKKRKKQSAWLKPLEKLERKALKGAARGLSTYRARHDRSNRKNRDGWLRDLEKNVWKAERKADKGLKLKRI